jgi:hypothetical protein
MREEHIERGEDRVGTGRTATYRGDPVAPPPEEETVADRAAPVAGGVAGAAAGATVGTIVAGPIGTLIGALAGAIGGWWAGAAVRRAAEVAPEDEAYYRAHYEERGVADRPYESARPAYHLGHVAAANPDYEARSFDDVEPELEAGWGAHTGATHVEWSGAREFARAAYERRRKRATEVRTEDIGTGESHRRPPFADPLPDASELSGPAGHPGIAGGPGDIPEPSSASRTAQPLPRPDIGPHAPNVTGDRGAGAK